MIVHFPHPASSDPPALVGRDHEWSVLGGLLADALSHEAETHGARVLVGRCYDRTETPPYGLWRDLFARYQAAGGIPEPPPPAFVQRDTLGAVASQAMLFNQVLDFVRAVAVRQPLALILDDIHWADPASLELLRLLARDCVTLPLLLVAAYRSDAVTRDHPLSPILPLLVREAGAARLDLRRLGEDALRAYVGTRYHFSTEDIASLAGYLAARTEGNPLFMTELLRTLEGDRVVRQQNGGWMLGALPQAGVPLLLRQVIEARLAHLGAESIGLLAIAAVIGQEASLALWRQVGRADEATLLALVERAVAARVIEETADGSGVTFVHALIREALYEGVPASRRRVWHRVIAEALIAAAAPDPDTVAYHLGAAGDGRVVEWLIRAGERADAAYAYLTADARFTAALAALDADDGDRILRCELLLLLSRLSRQRNPARSVFLLEEAVRLAREAGDLALMGETLHRLGMRRAFDGDRRRGIAQAEEGFRILDALPGDPARARPARIRNASISRVLGRGNLANRIAEVGRYAEATRHAEQVVATEQEGMTLETMNGWEALLSVARMMGRPAEARRHSATLWAFNRTLKEHDSARWIIGAELFWGALAYWPDDHAYLRHLQAEFDAHPLEAGEVFAALPCGTMHLSLFFVEGKWAMMRSIQEEVRQTRFVGHPFTQGIPLVLGRLFVAQGDAAAAWSLVRAEFPAGTAMEPGDNRFATGIALQRIAAELAIDAGDLPEARQWLEAHNRWLLWSGAVLGQAEGRLLWARLYRAGGDTAIAEEHARQGLAGATAPRQPLVLIAAHRLLGELATAAGRYDDADRHLDEAAALADACAAPYERALTLLARAELRAATGDTAAVPALLEEARAVCETLGARPALARADALIARPAPRPQEPGASLPDGLTGREVAVLRLLAQGGSNREIGTALGITTRTAERHISNIYTKIGAYSRAEAATYAIRHGLL